MDKILKIFGYAKIENIKIQEEFKKHPPRTNKMTAIKNLIKRNKELEKLELEQQKINGNLREKIKELEEKLEEKDMQHELELIGKEEYTKQSMGEIIEHYYTANEDCIPKSKIKQKIEELNNMLLLTSKGELTKYTVGEIILAEHILQELLEE